MTESVPEEAGELTGAIRYRRARFSARLYKDCLYTGAHNWLREEVPGLWRVGFTKFATRMLGEPVEIDFETPEGQEVQLGQEVGWVEGLKAVSDLYTPLAGIFRGGNVALREDIALLGRDPLVGGWLFRIEGTPGPQCLDLNGYVARLDATIDKMVGNAGPS